MQLRKLGVSRADAVHDGALVLEGDLVWEAGDLGEMGCCGDGDELGLLVLEDHVCLGRAGEGGALTGRGTAGEGLLGGGHDGVWEGKY